MIHDFSVFISFSEEGKQPENSTLKEYMRNVSKVFYINRSLYLEFAVAEL